MNKSPQSPLRGLSWDNRGQISQGAEALIGVVVTVLVVFYILAFCYTPLQTAGVKLQSSLGSGITNESLGTANGAGNLNATVEFNPVKAGSETVYADGTPSGSWVNAIYTLTDSTGEVVVTATGPGNTTANAEITIDYTREPKISGISGLSSLPGVAILLFVLLTVLGLILMATGRR